MRQVRLEADGIVSYELVAAGGEALPAFSAGAHIDLHIPGGMVRSYSLVNDPAETHRYMVAVHRVPDGRGGSAWMHGVPRVGDDLRISAPKNDFPLAEDASLSILFAGGIGITPLLAMARRLSTLGRPWRLHYSARSPQHAAFLDELRVLTQHGGELDLRFNSMGVPRLDLARLVKDAPADAHLYCCGPRSMIDDFLAASASRPQATVHYERFAAGTDAATAGGFDVVLQHSGLRLHVLPGKTILDTLLDNDISVQYSCSSGICGTCRTGVIEGGPDHRDDYLTDQEKRENRSIMICCSGSRSKTLVLDL
ncbi:PDR/VanB family oxidoreductase [Noviherbaspirillum pedocola]|uniref:PDR/VanB family oxidoreductase n=1 Tax=Noviherbaspirillum pedocola TaxID=2801341 RepID=UPI001F1C0367|nr:PDR/VanB family oxidoreductase [Noviherbaspirillum pedocola]